MRISRKQSHIILALLAICNNFICCNAAQCKTANDINPPRCELKDLKNKVLIDICKRVGYHHEPKATRKQLLFAAELCLGWDDLDLPSQTLVIKHMDEALENEARGRRLLLDYLDMLEDDSSFVRKSTHDRISYILSKHGVNDFEESVLRELLLGKLGEDDVDLEEQTPNFGLTPEEIAKLPKWSSRWNLTGLKEGHMKAFQKDGIVVASKWNAASKTWYKPLQLTESMDADDFVRKSIHYDHVLRVQNNLSVILIGYNNGDDPLDTAQAVIKEHLLDWKYLNRIADGIEQYIGESHPLSYIVSGAGSKHVNGRYDLSIQDNGERWYHKEIPATESDPEWAGKKLTLLRCTMGSTKKLWSISEVDIEQPCTDNDIDYYKNESGDKIIPRLVGWLTVLGIDPPPLLAIGSLSSEEESNRPTPEDIAMLPEWKSYKLPGISEGMKLFQKDGKAVTSEWNAKSKRWSRPEEIVEANYENSYFIKWMRASIQYEHAFPMTMGRGESEQHLTVGFNYGDDPLAVARRVVDEYNLDLTDADWYLLGIIEFVRERVTKIPRPTRMDQKEVHYWEELHRPWFIFILVLFALPGLIHLYTRLQHNKSMPRHKKRKKAMKPPSLSTAPPKIPSKKEKKKKESTLWSSVYTVTNNLYQNARSTSKSLSWPSVVAVNIALLYVILFCMGYWNLDCVLLQRDATEPYCTSDLYCIVGIGTTDIVDHLDIDCKPGQINRAAFVAFLWLLAFLCYGAAILPVLLVLWPLSTEEFVVFGSLCCFFLFGMFEPCKGRDPCEQWLANLTIVLVLLFVILLLRRLWKRLRPTLMLAFDFISGILRMPLDIYQAEKIKQTIYVQSPKSKSFIQRRKKKEIMNKSGVEDMQVDTSAVVDNYIPVHLTGSRLSVHEAIGLIQEAVGTEHVSTSKPSIEPISRRTKRNRIQKKRGQDDNADTSEPIQLKSSSSTAKAKGDDQNNLSIEVTPQPPKQQNIDTSSKTNEETIEKIDLNKEEAPTGPSTGLITQEQKKEKILHDNSVKASVSSESSPPPATIMQEEEEGEVPSEIGITSSQGMTRDTVTEASMTSLNDRSNISKAYSSFTLNEDDPLLIFLRSQASCIKGTVDEFYTWLVKSEDIDSMLALKEAVNEDDYLNDMKVGDGGGSGIKGFKRKAFLRAISEYFDDESDTKPDNDERKSKAAANTKLDEPPEELVCPISLNLMIDDPVVAADGITYERASIEDWFEKSKAKISEAEENLKQNPQSEADQRVVENGICSPVYGSKLDNLALVPHTGTRNMSRAFKEKTETSD